MKRPLITSSASQFVSGKSGDIPGNGKTYRSGKPTRLGAIQHEDIEETVIVTEAPTAAGGPMAMNRYIR